MTSCKTALTLLLTIWRYHLSSMKPECSIYCRVHSIFDQPLQVGSDKDLRTRIHKAIRENFTNLESATADDDGEKVIKVTWRSGKGQCFDGGKVKVMWKDYHCNSYNDLFMIYVLSFFNRLALGRCGFNLNYYISKSCQSSISWAFPVKLSLGLLLGNTCIGSGNGLLPWGLVPLFVMIHSLHRLGNSLWEVTLKNVSHVKVALMAVFQCTCLKSSIEENRNFWILTWLIWSTWTPMSAARKRPLTRWGLVTLHGDINLGQHCLR